MSVYNLPLRAQLPLLTRGSTCYSTLRFFVSEPSVRPRHLPLRALRPSELSVPPEPPVHPRLLFTTSARLAFRTSASAACTQIFLWGRGVVHFVARPSTYRHPIGWQRRSLYFRAHAANAQSAICCVPRECNLCAVAVCVRVVVVFVLRGRHKLAPTELHLQVAGFWN